MRLLRRNVVVTVPCLCQGAENELHFIAAFQSAVIAANSVAINIFRIAKAITFLFSAHR